MGAMKMMPRMETAPTARMDNVMASVAVRLIEPSSFSPAARETTETAPAPRPMETLITSMVIGKLIWTAACWAVPSVPTQ